MISSPLFANILQAMFTEHNPLATSSWRACRTCFSQAEIQAEDFSLLRSISLKKYMLEF